MVNKYSWLAYMNFTDSDGMKFRSYFISIILGLIILILTYNKVFNRKYQKAYLGYLFPGLVIANSVILIFCVAIFFQNAFFYYSPLWWPFILLNTLTIIISLSLYVLERFLIKPSMKFNVKLIMKVFLLLVLLLIPFGLSYKSEEMYFTSLVLCLTLALGRGAHLYFREINQSIINKKDVEMSKLKELKAQAEINSINARINPHFLYNSLNSIAGLVKSEPSKAEKMALSLSDMFRFSINRNNDQFLTIKEEVEVVRTYLEIEQIRFGDKLEYVIEVDGNCEELKIPRFLIQPLVENAVKHGVSKIEETGIIRLGIKQLNERLIIAVSDNGPAFPEGLVGGYGIQGIYDLLNLIYGDQAELSWQNKPEKSISIKIDITKLSGKL
jgi:sensor histidine kinase YesM